MLNFFKKKNKPSPLGEAQMQTIFETLEDGVITYSRDFRIESVNKAAEATLGIKREAVVGKIIKPNNKNTPELSALTQIIFPSLAPVVTQISESGWPQIAEMQIENPDLKLRTTLNRLTDAAGNPAVFVKIVRNKTRETEILESKREFLSVAAHQLRTPLNAIKWAFETLKTNPENQTSIVEQGEALAARSLKIIDDLLNAARIEGGKFGYNYRNIELGGLLKQITDQAAPIAKSAGLRLTFTPPQGALQVEVDPDRLLMAISNIIDNAIHYNTKRGAITVYAETLQNQPYIRVTIQDTGIGISESEQRNLFKKFSRGERAKQIEPNGSGLGLFIARNIIKNHGGEIYVNSTENRGSTFSFTLPTDPSRIPKRETTYETE